MHETFTELAEPRSTRLIGFLKWYGAEARPFSDFDILTFPEQVGWTSVTQFHLSDQDRYEFDRTSTTFVGADVVSILETDETGKAADQSDEASFDRWAPFHWEAIKTKQPVFAETFVHGIGKEFIKYEVGAFPFFNGRGRVEHIVLIMSVL